jgi:synaptic vesicle membrane protein VAT-1
VIDKSRQDLWQTIEENCADGFDMVLDANGPETLRQSYLHLRPMGKLIVYGSHTVLPKSGGKINYLVAGLKLLKNFYFNPLRLVTENKGIIGFNLSFLFDQIDLYTQSLNQLLEWMNQGRLKPPRVTEFAFEEVAKAHQAIESGQTIGKLVLITSRSV